MRTLFIIAVIAGMALGGLFLYGGISKQTPVSRFRVAEVERGDLLLTVSATGIIQPEEVVDVGAQVVGRIKKLGEDPRGETDDKFKGKPVDYCTPVKKGMVLAVIDPAVYQAQFNQAAAAVERAKADLLQMEAKRAQTNAEWERAQRLRNLKLSNISPTGTREARNQALPIKGISDADFILAKANSEIAKAMVEVGKATVAQQESAKELAATNLGYTVITSPVDGTIIERRVDIGQTVVSAMNAPSLFFIAEDLRRMEVWASVNEADIGRLKEGMPVRFTVDAFPRDEFSGVVSQIRLNASMTQNVVLYTVAVSAANPDLKLLPYLTADVKFEVEHRKGVLLVPNAALRFEPKSDQIAPVAETPGSADARSGKERSHLANDDADSNADVGTVWVQKGHFLEPLEVKLGPSDGVHTEVFGSGAKEGLEVVVGEQREDVDTQEVNNPFGPPKFRGPKRR
jgi:HlyD family secretion protein